MKLILCIVLLVLWLTLGYHASSDSLAAGAGGPPATQPTTMPYRTVSATTTQPSGAAKPEQAEMEEAASARSPIVGKPAPDFTLTNQDNKPVSLDKLKGQWIVLYFYPKDDTPGCACQATEFTALLSQFGDLHTEIYGVSTDSIEDHQKFIKKYSLRINLLGDPDHKVMESYGRGSTPAWAVRPTAA